MRVKLGDRIYFCIVATHPHNSKLMLLTTSNGVYTVNMGSILEAYDCHDKLLTNGWYDFTGFDYSN